jgi:PAS domain S-box-containing protein
MSRRGNTAGAGGRQRRAAGSGAATGPIGVQLRAVFENSGDAISVSKAGTLLFVNPSYRALFGYPRDADLAGVPVLDLIAPGCRAQIQELVARRARGDRASSTFETRGLRADGTEFDVEVTVSTYQEGGEILSLAILRDVTARRRAEEESAERGAMLQHIMDTAAVAIGVVDLTGRMSHANRRMAEMFRYPPEELAGIEYVELVHPEEREEGRRSMQALLASRIPAVDLVRRYLRKDGSEFWGHLACQRLHDVRGHELGLLGVISDVTEARRAEEALRAAEQKYRSLIETTDTGYVILDGEGRVSDANQEYVRLTGRARREDVLGHSVLEWTAPHDHARNAAEVRKCVEQGAVRNLELDYVGPDGTFTPVEINATVLRTGGGLSILSLCRDITERRRTAAALAKSEKMLQTIIEAEPECVKVLDENANLILMNRAGLDMIQVESLEQVKGRCVCPMVASEHRPAFMELTRRVFRGESGTLAFEIVGARGRRLWLETHAVPLRDERDEIVALLGVTRDITERKRTEDALRSSEARFRAIIEHATEGLIVADAETGRIQYANPEICRGLGYDEQELLALRAADLAVAEESGLAAAGFRAVAEGRVRSTERSLRRKDGSAIRMRINNVRIELDGRPCLVGFFADVTAQRLLEEERLKTQKLESLGTLAGGIAHDFNNLLQGVFGYISMARLSLDQKGKARAMLEQAERALHQSVSLTSQLLTFSKGGKPLKRLVALQPLVEDAAHFALSGSRAVCVLSIAGDLLPVEADPGQLGQVIQNIVLNAAQAMPLGGRIEVTARNVPAAAVPGLPPGLQGDLVAIAVRDEGTGIPPEHLPRIFDPYFTTKEKGSGLGLATSYSIVRNHDGAITVASEPGKGSTFTVYLPASRAERMPEGAPPPPPSTRRGRVLVMDDHAVVRTVAAQLLRALGHEAVTAEHGAEAVAKYREAKAAGRPFDVVILDLTVPGGMGGAEAIGKLREIDPGVNAVVSSGYSDDAASSEYREKGFRAYLNKPYTIEGLRAVLAELLG